MANIAGFLYLGFFESGLCLGVESKLVWHMAGSKHAVAHGAAKLVRITIPGIGVQLDCSKCHCMNQRASSAYVRAIPHTTKGHIKANVQLWSEASHMEPQPRFTLSSVLVQHNAAMCCTASERAEASALEWRGRLGSHYSHVAKGLQHDA